MIYRLMSLLYGGPTIIQSLYNKEGTHSDKKNKSNSKANVEAIHNGVCYSCVFIKIKILKSASLFVFLSGEHL